MSTAINRQCENNIPLYKLNPSKIYSPEKAANKRPKMAGMCSPEWISTFLTNNTYSEKVENYLKLQRKLNVMKAWKVFTFQMKYKRIKDETEEIKQRFWLDF